MKTVAYSQAQHRAQIAAWLQSPAGLSIAAMHLEQVIDHDTLTLEEAGLEEVEMERQPVFGGFYQDSTVEHCSGGCYEVCAWFYENDSSALELTD